MPIPRGNNDVSENSVPYEDEKFIRKEQKMKEHYRDLVGKSLDTRSHAKSSVSKHTT